MDGKTNADFEIVVSDKKSATEELIDSYYQIIHFIWKELHPLAPLPSVESMKWHFFEPVLNKQTFSWNKFLW